MKTGPVSKTFVKYLSSYIFAFLVPLLFTFVFIYNYVFNIYKNEVLFNEKAQNIIFRDTMDVQVKQLYNMAEQIRIEDEFKYYYNTTAFNRMTSYKKLYGYDFANSLVSNIAYFQSNIDTAITSNGTCLKENLSAFLIKYHQWPQEQMLEDMFRYPHPAWRSFEEITFGYVNPGRYMTFIYPVMALEKGVKSVLFFNIKEEDFLKILNISQSNEKNSYLILGKDGKVLYSSVPVMKNIEALLPAIAESATNEVRQIEGGGRFLSYTHSNFNEFIYINILPVSTALEKVNQLKQIVFFLFMVIVLIGIVIIYIFMYLNYNPIKSLKSFIENNFSKIPGSDNEIETAKLAISMLAETSSRMQEKVDSSMKAVRSTMLYELLWGDYKNIHAFNRFGKDYGIRITGTSFCIAAFTGGNSIRSLEKGEHKMLEFIETELKGIPCIYGVENLERNSLVFILSLDGIGENELEQRLISLRERINHVFSADMMIGLSRKCGPEDHIYNLYIEAVTAIEHAASIPSKIGEDIIRFGGSNMTISMEYPEDEIDKFKNTIISSDVDSFNTISMYLLNYIGNANVDYFMAMCILNDMVNAITKGLIKVNRKDFLERFQTMLAIPGRGNNVALLKENVYAMCIEISEYMKNKGEGANETQIEKIKQYVGEHFGEYDFSLQALADRFSMSLSNIGHYFKKNTGMTLSEYLSQLKLEEAKKMLRNTDMTLEEIVEKIGYISISSFIRRFKQEMKATPGEYRLLYKKQCRGGEA